MYNFVSIQNHYGTYLIVRSMWLIQRVELRVSILLRLLPLQSPICLISLIMHIVPNIGTSQSPICRG